MEILRVRTSGEGVLRWKVGEGGGEKVGQLEWGWPRKADWATVGPVEIGAYESDAMLFARPEGLDESGVSLSIEQLEGVGHACAALAKKLRERRRASEAAGMTMREWVDREMERTRTMPSFEQVREEADRETAAWREESAPAWRDPGVPDWATQRPPEPLRDRWRRWQRPR